MIFLTASRDCQWLVGTTFYGFQVWNLNSLTCKALRLPHDHRNLTHRSGQAQLVTFSNDGELMATAVRELIFIWDLRFTAEPRRLPPMHYLRIIGLQSVPSHLGNKIISSSFDHSINVWDLDNTGMATYTLEKHSRPIEDIVVAANVDRAITVTQKDIKVWALLTGECLSTITTV